MARTTEGGKKASEMDDLVEVVPAPEATERPHRLATAEGRPNGPTKSPGSRLRHQQ